MMALALSVATCVIAWRRDVALKSDPTTLSSCCPVCLVLLYNLPLKSLSLLFQGYGDFVGGGEER